MTSTVTANRASVYQLVEQGPLRHDDTGVRLVDAADRLLGRMT